MALATFLAITGLAFIALTEAGVGLLEALAARHPATPGSAVPFYAPMLVIFLVVSVTTGLWASHRSFYRPRHRSLVRSVLLVLLSISALLGAGFVLLSFALPKNDQPPLAYGLYGSWQDMSKAFAQRLQKRFPVGSSEDALLTELRTKRFKIDLARREALFDGDGFPCRNIWYVQWQSNDRRLLAVTGSGPTIPVCL